MTGWAIKVDLAKPREPIGDVLSKQPPIYLHVILECDLGPRTKADRDLRVVRTGKAPGRRGLEFGRNQRFRNLGGTAGLRRSHIS